MQSILLVIAIGSGSVMLLALAWPVLPYIKQLRLKHRRLMRFHAQPRYVKVKAVLNEDQRHTFGALQEIMGEDLSVFPQMPLAALVQLQQGDPQRYPDRTQFIQTQSVDFVICDRKSTQIVLVVALFQEQNEDTEVIQRRQKLESILKEAGIALLPLACRKSRTSLQLAQTVQQSLSEFLTSESRAA